MGKFKGPSFCGAASVVVLLMAVACSCLAPTRTSFLGNSLSCSTWYKRPHEQHCAKSYMEMRKQKASDKRTRRRQRGEDTLAVEAGLVEASLDFMTTSPMQGNSWKRKSNVKASYGDGNDTNSGGTRQRSRKRNAFYNSLAFYHNLFLQQLTLEYKSEEDQILGRIKASAEDPMGLEVAGHCFFDMEAERRGNLFSDEVYRLVKAPDATTLYTPNNYDEDAHPSNRNLPPNHKFTMNDVILLTLQPNGSGDFFGVDSLPTSVGAVTLEARVLNMGPTYLDIAVAAGSFEAAFGPARNDFQAGPSAKSTKLRVDRFFSPVSYQRMVEALMTLTNVNERKPPTADDGQESSYQIHMDDVLKEVILQTYPSTENPSLEPSQLQELANRISKPPMGNSIQLTKSVMKFIRSSNDVHFPKFNGPQMAAIEAALTRRLTLIHGPPGTGKTTVASAIAFGFVHQSRSLSSHTKVLACAFSNVGADNLAESMQSKLGLNVIRVGKAAAVSESLWDVTLEAAIDRDRDAQKALQLAAKATAALTAFQRAKKTNGNTFSERTLRETATLAVKASIQACNLAATKALRRADVIVSTSTGAADPRLLAACGLSPADNDDTQSSNFREASSMTKPGNLGDRSVAPDGLPPLSLPFVLIDEACQSVEPASLIPIVSSDSCRSLVLLGDPCQLPPTVKSREASELSMSLMERLAAVLPAPTSGGTHPDSAPKDSSYLKALAIKQARSLVNARGMDEYSGYSYRQRFKGSFLLSVQYRMHPSIAAFPSAIFYDSMLSTPIHVGDENTFPEVLGDTMPCADRSMSVRVVDVGGRCSERQGSLNRFSRTVFGESKSVSTSLEEQTTYWNEAESERVLEIIYDIVSDPTQEIRSIGVISPYNGQVQLIKATLAGDERLRMALSSNPVSIEVKSVDGYQGRERDVIIFSAVRSNRKARIGFLRDWRRMNVALTRAKSGLVIVGDLDTLSEADRHWDGLRKWSTELRCLLDDSDSLDEEASI